MNRCDDLPQPLREEPGYPKITRHSLENPRRRVPGPARPGLVPHREQRIPQREMHRRRRSLRQAIWLERQNYPPVTRERRSLFCSLRLEELQVMEILTLKLLRHCAAIASLPRSSRK